MVHAFHLLRQPDYDSVLLFSLEQRGLDTPTQDLREGGTEASHNSSSNVVVAINGLRLNARGREYLLETSLMGFDFIHMHETLQIVQPIRAIEAITDP